MRNLSLVATAALVGFLSVPALAQTDNEAVQTVPTAQEIAETRQSSWYGEPFALSGQDVVSFGSAGGPVPGSKAFKAEWDNTEWRFASAENRDEFLKDPERYVPEFGGYCPVALAQGDLKIGAAEHFNIVDDKLYVNFDKTSSDLFGGDSTGYIAAAKLNF